MSYTFKLKLVVIFMVFVLEAQQINNSHLVLLVK